MLKVRNFFVDSRIFRTFAAVKQKTITIMARHFLDIAYEEALATDNELKKFFRKQYNAVRKENAANG